MTISLKRISTVVSTSVWTCLTLICHSYAEPHLSGAYVGVGSCSSSNCHGSVKPLKSSKVLQNEYVTWLKHDKHSQAYAALAGDEGKRMATLLAIPDATKEPRCLKCHSTYVPEPTKRGERFQVEDGVSCESCHGAAEHWLSSHTDNDSTHQQNLENGLADTASLPNRATLCLSCHQGNSDQWVDHDLYGAGHPRLSFELDTFGISQPKHWVVDEDYEKRKQPYVPLRAWLVGQYAHAKGSLAALSSSERSTNGSLPELSLFDCFSCHHSLTEHQWKQRTYNGKPGRLKLNLPSLIILQEALAALDTGAASALKEQLKTLHDNYVSMGQNPELANITQLLESRVRALVTNVSADDKTAAALFEKLTHFAASTPWLTYEVAEQVAMGIQAILASSPPLAKRYSQQLDTLFDTLKTPEAFNPAGFTRACQAMRAGK